MSSRLKPKPICVRSLVPKEKNCGRLGHLVGQQARPRESRSSCRTGTATSTPGLLLRPPSCTRSTITLVTSSSFTSQVTGTMISGLGVLAGLDQLGGGLEDRPDLHLGDLGIGDARGARRGGPSWGWSRAAARRASGRRPTVMPRALASSACAASSCGTNSCSGGSSRRMVTGRPSIASSVALMSRLTKGNSSSTRLLALFRRRWRGSSCAAGTAARRDPSP